jgi:cytochrome c553
LSQGRWGQKGKCHLFFPAAPKGALPARKIPGITAADTHPGACVDCHVNDKVTNHDTRFSTLMKGWTSTVPPALLTQAKGAAPKGMVLKGKHPAVPASGLRNVPGSCRACHGQTSKMAPPLGPMMHVIHLTGGEKNTFLTMFQGECTLCHKLDGKSGAWTIPSGPEK